MSGTPYQKTRSKTLAAASANNIAQSQAVASATNLTLNGSAVSGGVATLDVLRRVLIASSGNSSGITFTVYGTGINDVVQSETLTGPGAALSVYTRLDFKTITRVATSAAATGNITVGTNGVGSTTPQIVDAYISQANYSWAVVVSGTVSYTIDISYEDFGPSWDVTTTPPNWFSVSGENSANSNGIINGPVTMIRLTNQSGTGTATLTVLTPMGTGPI